MTLELTPPSAETDATPASDPVDEPAASTDATDPDATPSRVVELPTRTGTARLTLPFDADASEAAAVAAAVAAHLSAEGADEPAPTVDRWKLAERLGSRRGARLPVDCSQGDAWKLAGRRQSW